MSAPSVSHDYVGDQPGRKPAVRTRPNPLVRALHIAASLRITAALFGLSMALVFFGTLGMTLDSIDETVKKYFRTWVAWIDLQGLAEFGKVFLHLPKDSRLSIKLPFPGGYTIGWLMFINLLAAHIVRFKLTWKRSGIFLLHAGVIVLLAGEFLTGQMQVETRMMVREGESNDYAFSLTEHELAVVDPSDPNHDQVVSVPGEMLVNAKPGDWISHPDLPFDVQVKRHFINSTVRPIGPEEQPEADRGLGRSRLIEALPKVKGTDSEGAVNAPAAYLVLRDKAGAALGTYLFAVRYERAQTVTAGDKEYQVAYRFKRTYKPYKVHVHKAEYDFYPGTKIAKDYASTVTVQDPEFGDHGPIRIWMNHPMYYRGETFYQSTMDTESEGPVTTGLQVVRNPAWTFPYFACAMVALGMIFHFLLRLTAFLPKVTVRAPTAGPQPVKAFERYFPLGLAALAALMLIGRAMPPSPRDDRFDFYGFGHLPVQHGGRVQPLDSVARNSLMVISGKSEVEDPANKDRVYSSTEWLLMLWAKPDDADKLKVIRADHPQVLALLGLPQRPGFYRYSYAELEPGFDKLENQRQVAGRKAKDKRDAYDTRVLQLSEHLGVYNRLKARATPGFLPTEDPDAKWLTREDVFRTLGPEILPEADRKAKEQIAAEIHNPDFLPGLVQKYLGGMRNWDEAEKKLGGREEVIKALVEQETKARQRKLAFEKYKELEAARFPNELVFNKMVDAYERDKTADFNAAVVEYKERFTTNVSDSDKSKVGLETRMNRFDPFLQCEVLYIGVIILTALSWLVWRQPLRRAAFAVACVTLVVHTAALLARMYIGNRPPVTNLYSSAVFIGWGGLVLCLILERFYRLGIGTFAGGLLGFATLYIARFLSESGDTLEMLQAVLDTNFWLATHVTTVTMGYMATMVAGVIAIAYIIGGVFTNGLRGEVGRLMSGMIYGTVCFAMLLSFTGTVLGGIWADQSWGRFWGWDPKENGAVLIVIWNALILHARWGGIAKARGIAVLAVIGCIWTVWSWFGTNQLGIGLHAYGFDSRLADGCSLSWVFLGLIAALGMVPLKYWASFGPATGKTQASGAA